MGTFGHSEELVMKRNQGGTIPPKKSEDDPPMDKEDKYFQFLMAEKEAADAAIGALMDLQLKVSGPILLALGTAVGFVLSRTAEKPAMNAAVGVAAKNTEESSQLSSE